MSSTGDPDQGEGRTGALRERRAHPMWGCRLLMAQTSQSEGDPLPGRMPNTIVKVNAGSLIYRRGMHGRNLMLLKVLRTILSPLESVAWRNERSMPRPGPSSGW